MGFIESFFPPPRGDTLRCGAPTHQIALRSFEVLAALVQRHQRVEQRRAQPYVRQQRVRLSGPQRLRESANRRV